MKTKLRVIKTTDDVCAVLSKQMARFEANEITSTQGNVFCNFASKILTAIKYKLEYNLEERKLDLRIGSNNK